MVTLLNSLQIHHFYVDPCLLLTNQEGKHVTEPSAVAYDTVGATLEVQDIFNNVDIHVVGVTTSNLDQEIPHKSL